MFKINNWKGTDNLSQTLTVKYQKILETWFSASSKFLCICLFSRSKILLEKLLFYKTNLLKNQIFINFLFSFDKDFFIIICPALQLNFCLATSSCKIFPIKNFWNFSQAMFQNNLTLTVSEYCRFKLIETRMKIKGFHSAVKIVDYLKTLICF